MSATGWFVRRKPRRSAPKILSNYALFQEWYWERELASGASEDDIRAYPTVQLVEAMRTWVDDGRPD